MTARVTRAAQAPPYSPPGHQGVEAHRLQGLEAGPTERFWVGRSVYAPGGTAQQAPTAGETVYVVTDGEITVTVGGQAEVLGTGDSIHLPRGTVREVVNRSDRPAGILVVIATPQENAPQGNAPQQTAPQEMP